MITEQKMKKDDAHIDFELDNMPFMDGQNLNETCVLYDSPHNLSVTEESIRLQYSAELH